MQYRWMGRAAGLVGALLLLGSESANAQAAAAVHIDPAWLQSNPADSSVEVSLIAGLGGINGGMSFNGTTNGALTLVVPVGWHVVVHFRNADQNMPHSAEVIAAVNPVPVAFVRPAIARAATRRPEQGLPSDQHEDFRFVAEPAGAYLMFCAVTGHGAAGMWLKLDVSATARRPSFAATSR